MSRIAQVQDIAVDSEPLCVELLRPAKQIPNTRLCRAMMNLSFVFGPESLVPMVVVMGSAYYPLLAGKPSDCEARR
jgi:hypothetical protein